MSNILDLVEEPGPDVTRHNALKYIWFFPTSTFRYLLKNAVGYRVTLLFVLQGVVSALNRASSQNLGDDSDVLMLEGVAVIAGGVVGFAMNHFAAWLLYYTGKLLRGKGNYPSICTIVAWSWVPFLAGSLIFAIKFALYGALVFKSDMEIENLAVSAAFVTFGILETVLFVWSMVLMWRGVALVQGFGWLKALANLILPFIVIAVVAILAAVAWFTLGV